MLKASLIFLAAFACMSCGQIGKTQQLEEQNTELKSMLRMCKIRNFDTMVLYYNLKEQIFVCIKYLINLNRKYHERRK